MRIYYRRPQNNVVWSSESIESRTIYNWPIKVNIWWQILMSSWLLDNERTSRELIVLFPTPFFPDRTSILKTFSLARTSSMPDGERNNAVLDNNKLRKLTSDRYEVTLTRIRFVGISRGTNTLIWTSPTSGYFSGWFTLGTGTIYKKKWISGKEDVTILRLQNVRTFRHAYSHI